MQNFIELKLTTFILYNMYVHSYFLTDYYLILNPTSINVLFIVAVFVYYYTYSHFLSESTRKNINWHNTSYI